ncbi:hypothetical protein HOG16_02685 [Candidatus Woesearchaeota archaeon]|jgi:hypothetical protein|nr:hypothetical protein [Candidatus Woesearchaeota archaeon]MBT4322004.1 hypothetical protein [Candidatus Woesearchaeota archaeon]MBT4630750.1 hypothetical protein [Candidatus Woesearchaeota archaeon]
MKKSLVGLVLLSLVGCGSTEEFVSVEKPVVVDSLVISNGEFDGFVPNAIGFNRFLKVVDDSLGFYSYDINKKYYDYLDYVLETTGEDGNKYVITLGFDHKKILVSEME